MEIRLIVIGKTATDYLRSGIEEYCARLKRYVPFRIQVLADTKTPRSAGEQRQKDAEGRLILQNVAASDCLILLDERGKEYSSRGFADFLNKKMASGLKQLVFVIGGPYGFSEEVYKRADSKISLSQLTFNHEMVRLFFVEQVYRAMTILAGEPYHHD